jgi:hypothetical protein
MFQNFCQFKKVVRQRRRRFVHRGFSIPLLTVFISVPAVVADTVFTDISPGPVNFSLEPGSYQIMTCG